MPVLPAPFDGFARCFVIRLVIPGEVGIFAGGLVVVSIRLAAQLVVFEVVTAVRWPWLNADTIDGLPVRPPALLPLRIRYCLVRICVESGYQLLSPVLVTVLPSALRANVCVELNPPEACAMAFSHGFARLQRVTPLMPPRALQHLLNLSGDVRRSGAEVSQFVPLVILLQLRDRHSRAGIPGGSSGVGALHFVERRQFCKVGSVEAHTSGLIGFVVVRFTMWTPARARAFA